MRPALTNEQRRRAEHAASLRRVPNLAPVRVDCEGVVSLQRRTLLAGMLAAMQSSDPEIRAEAERIYNRVAQMQHIDD